MTHAELGDKSQNANKVENRKLGQEEMIDYIFTYVLNMKKMFYF